MIHESRSWFTSTALWLDGLHGAKPVVRDSACFLHGGIETTVPGPAFPGRQEREARLLVLLVGRRSTVRPMHKRASIVVTARRLAHLGLGAARRRVPDVGYSFGLRGPDASPPASSVPAIALWRTTERTHLSCRRESVRSAAELCRAPSTSGVSPASSARLPSKRFHRTTGLVRREP